MGIVDERGRLFGRLNVVDAVVAVFVLGLIPLLYGSAVLFRTPTPKLTSIEPASFASGPGHRLVIHGENLRPYMRISFGNIQALNFLFKSVNEAQVDLNDMPPGTYDVVLFDVAQEQARLVKGLTVLPSALPPTKITLVGVFGNLDADRAKSVKPGDVVAGVGTIRAIGEPIPAQARINSNGLIIQIPVEKSVMLPAEVEGVCDMLPRTGIPYCLADGTSLQPTIVLMGQHAVGKLPFQIDQVRGPAPQETIEVVARFTAAPQVIGAIRSGDVDYGIYANPLAAGATVVEVRSRALNDVLTQADVRLRLRAQRGSEGWVYESLPLRAGGEIALRNARYQLPGAVLTISPEWSKRP